MKSLSVILVFGMLFTVLDGVVIANEDEEVETYDNYPAKFYGVVENMPNGGGEGLWTVNNREILVTTQTKIEEEYGKAGVGAYIEVEGNYIDKTFTAYKIEVRMEKQKGGERGQE
ncbi:MAG: DUF5666 domain-containing protein [Nitrospirota bacterium]